MHPWGCRWPLPTPRCSSEGHRWILEFLGFSTPDDLSGHGKKGPVSVSIFEILKLDLVAQWLFFFFEKKVDPTEIKHSSAYGYMHKDCLRKKKWAKKSSGYEAIPFHSQGEAITIWRSLGSDFWSQNWKSMWKPHTVSILYFIEKKILLFIFQTLFSEIDPISDNFGIILFLVKLLKVQKEIVLK